MILYRVTHFLEPSFYLYGKKWRNLNTLNHFASEKIPVISRYYGENIRYDYFIENY